ncbi:MAG: hypothetical protein JSR18_05280 [Proteobacteria bacterium]|nr:hypothetical protein [Pseudomonadota bacterium]
MAFGTFADAQGQMRTGTLVIQAGTPTASLSIPLEGFATATAAAQLPTTFVGATPANDGLASVTVSGTGACSAVRCGFAESGFATLDSVGVPTSDDHSFPHGIFSAVIGECAVNSPVLLQYTFAHPLPAGTTYMHYGATDGDRMPHWYSLPAIVRDNTISVTLKDGFDGDDDLASNGIVSLRGGPVVATDSPVPSAIKVPALDSAKVGIVALVLFCAGLLALRRRGIGRELMLVAIAFGAGAVWWTQGVLSANAQLATPLTSYPTSVAFPAQDMGKISPAQRVTITNSTAGTVQIAGITVQGDFEEINDCPPTLNAAQSCSVDVRFVTTACTSSGPPLPPPVLTSAAPPSLVASGQPQPVILGGENFASGAVVLVGPDVLAPTSVASTSIALTIPASLTTTASTLTLRVRNPDLQESGALDVPVVDADTLTLIQLSPAQLPAYGSAHLVDLVGQGFAPGAIAVIGGMPMNPQSASGSVLSVEVPGTMLEHPGILQAFVRNPDHTTSNTLALAVVDGVSSSGPAPIAIKILDPLDGAVEPRALVAVSGSHVGAERIVVRPSCVAATISGSTFQTPEVPLMYGDNIITAFAFGKSGTVASDSIVVRSSVPSIAIDPALKGAQVDDDSVLVAGTYIGPSGSTVTVNGVRAMVAGSSYSALIGLDFGPNAVQAVVTSPDSVVAKVATTITDTLPSLQITSPLAEAQVASDHIDVSGTFRGDPSTPIKVNGVAATTSGNTFTAKSVPLVHARNELKAVAISPTGRTVARSVMVMNTQPSITIASPADGVIIAAATAVVTGVVTAKQGPSLEQAVVTVNGVVATRSGNRGPYVPTPPFGNDPYGDGARYLIQDYTATIPLAAGVNAITATVVAPDGQSQSRQISVIRPEAVLAVTQPANGAITYDDNVVVYGRIDGSATNVSANGVTAIRDGSEFAVRVPLQAGANVINVVASTSAGPTSVALNITRGTLGIAITRPLVADAIADSVAQVSGTYDGPADASVTVNGSVAILDHGKFYANNVPLRTGDNLLSAVVAIRSGSSSTASVSVTRSTEEPPPVELAVDPAEGLAPHRARVYLMNNTGSPVTRIEVDTNEGGSGSTLTLTPQVAFGVDYPTAGVFQMRVRVSTQDGNAYDLRQVIRVRTAQDLDVELRGIYSDMLTHLKARDIDGAMPAITGGSNARYYAIFKSLSLPSVIDKLGTLVGGTLDNEMAEYALVRDTTNGPQAFLIYFIRSEDGIWRIDSM